MFTRGWPILFLLATAPVATAQSDFTKVIPGVRTVELARELPGYAFYTVYQEPLTIVPDQPPPIPVYRATRIELVPKVKKTVPGELYVVPESAVKEKADEKVLGFALAQSQIPGAHGVPQVFAEEVSTDDPRTEIRVHFVIQSVDPNAGLIYDRTSNDPNDPHNLVPPPGKNAENGNKPKGPSWLLIGGGILVVVVAAAVAIVVMVLKFARNKKIEDDEDDDEEE